MDKCNSNLRKSDHEGMVCSTCEFCMPDNEGHIVCAGSSDNYGRIITDNEQKELFCDAWEESFEHFVQRRNK